MTGNTILITGATGKLGQIIAADLVANGWSVIVTSRNKDRADAMAVALSNTGPGRADGIALDLDVPGGIEAAVAQIRERGLRPTHLLNNARSLDTLAVGDDGVTTEAAFTGELAVDVVRPYQLTMALAGRPDSALINVVNIGSQYGEVAPNAAPYEGTLDRSPIQYGVAKAALHHMTRELAVRLAPRVRVNCVAFGGFSGRADQAFLNRYQSMCPSGRMLKDEEAAGPVRFLLGEESSSVNGHVLVADLGWSIW